VSEETGRADPPAALLVGIWQFRDAILAREQAFLDHGGALIFPLPTVDQVLIGGRRAAG
jgi:NDP-4-keto-2,6-dideoxyhexose 3-C-methyltransferase